MINFSKDDWARIKETYQKWWNGEQNRPILNRTVTKNYTYNGTVPLLSQANCENLSISASDLIDRIDLHLQNQIYLEESFPFVTLDTFGPGLLSAFLGAKLDNSSGRVWFHPEKELDIKDIHFEYDKNNIWLNRIRDIYNAGNKKWKGNVLMGMPDLGGALDILAVFRGTQDLLMDLYDEPAEVKRLEKELLELWFKIYNELNEVLQPVNPGFSDWSGIYSDKPSYIIQSDFSYMISNDMFKEFALDNLKEFCKRLPNSIYHLDGAGQLPHLDDILSIKELNAVQWVPGDGSKPAGEWYDVNKRIHAAGKGMYVAGGENDLLSVIKTVGTKNLYYIKNF